MPKVRSPKPIIFWIPTENAGHSGFTLLELLISVAMTAVITLAVYGTYRSIVSVADIHEKRIRYLEMAAGCIERMRADVQGLAVRMREEFVPTMKEASADPLMIRIQPADEAIGANERKPFLRMTSRSVVPVSPQDTAGIADIRYELTPDPNGGWNIRRAQRLLPFSERSEHAEQRELHPIVCSGVRSVHVAAVNGKGERMERWDSNASDNRYETPKAVFLRLEVGEGGDSVHVETLIHLPVRRSSGPQEPPKSP
uniref:Type II secretion system protein n=1 Tax=Desulfatirhabdium butyrativorans TaxID=340467 RepID=A0A7C4MRF5_9BACT